MLCWNQTNTYFYQKVRGHWAVYYTSLQSFIITFFIRWLCNFGDFYWNLIGWFIKLSVQSFQPLIVIYRRGNILEIRINSSTIVLSFSIPKLLPLFRTELDYGTLYCAASNEVGLQEQACSYHLVAAGPPESVFNCTLSNQSASGVQVHCLPGFNGGIRYATLHLSNLVWIFNYL